MNEPAVDVEEGLGRKELKRIVGRFQALSDARLARIRASLTHEQRSLFDLLPLLWHVNHPTLPGFVSTETPAGIIGFRPSREQLLLARRYVRGFREDKQHPRDNPIRGLYLMGSMGSLGQTAGSDLDFWLCLGDQVNAGGRAALQEKATLIERRAAENGLHAHFFLMHAESFRAGVVEQLSKESSGATQHTLLLEEFYRTGILLAGNPLLWWAVPPEHEDDYQAYTERLIRKRFIRADRWLDFGGLQSLPPEEFFGVAHWQLFKGIDAPYKSLLKLMLLEAYAAEYPKVDWLCMETKRAVYGSQNPNADGLDPYLLILDRITQYLSARNEPERLQLARRAFYFKAGQLLARNGLRTDWRYQLMLQQTRKWQWQSADLALMDSRPEWKVERVIEERNALVSELSRSYRLLTDFAREQGAEASLDPRELALLGRKLYAALDKRPGKVERINPGISRDLVERTLWLRRIADEPVRWQLFLRSPGGLESTPLKTSISLIEILAWLHINGICERSTQVHYLPKPGGYGEPEQDKILKTLRKRLPRVMPADATLDAYAQAARGRQSIWFVNVGHDPLASLAGAGYQLISERVDALSFGAAHECLVSNIEHLFTTTWGEVRVERHTDGAEGLLQCLCRHLDLFAPHERRPTPISAYSFSSTRGGAIANRVARLAHAVSDTFHTLGTAARYLIRMADSFYQLHHDGEKYAWALIGENEDLEHHLAEPLSQFAPTRIDRVSMQDSPLPMLLTHNQAGVIQTFYLARGSNIDLYVFDERGALFQQRVSNTDEYHLLVHMQRFIDSVVKRRMLTPAADDTYLDVEFYRITAQSGGDWQSTPVRVPRNGAVEHVELVLVINPSGRLQDGFRLLLGNHEFDSLLYGDRLYAEVAQRIVRMRHSGLGYAVYLTGVIGADDDSAAPCRLPELLRLKKQVEQRLADVMRQAKH